MVCTYPMWTKRYEYPPGRRNYDVGKEGREGTHLTVTSTKRTDCDGSYPDTSSPITPATHVSTTTSSTSYIAFDMYML